MFPGDAMDSKTTREQFKALLKATKNLSEERYQSALRAAAKVMHVAYEWGPGAKPQMTIHVAPGGTIGPEVRVDFIYTQAMNLVAWQAYASQPDLSLHMLEAEFANILSRFRSDRPLKHTETVYPTLAPLFQYPLKGKIRLKYGSDGFSIASRAVQHGTVAYV